MSTTVNVELSSTSQDCSARFNPSASNFSNTALWMGQFYDEGNNEKFALFVQVTIPIMIIPANLISAKLKITANSLAGNGNCASGLNYKLSLSGYTSSPTNATDANTQRVAALANPGNTGTIFCLANTTVYTYDATGGFSGFDGGDSVVLCMQPTNEPDSGGGSVIKGFYDYTDGAVTAPYVEFIYDETILGDGSSQSRPLLLGNLY